MSGNPTKTFVVVGGGYDPEITYVGFDGDTAIQNLMSSNYLEMWCGEKLAVRVECQSYSTISTERWELFVAIPNGDGGFESETRTMFGSLVGAVDHIKGLLS